MTKEQKAEALKKKADKLEAEDKARQDIQLAEDKEAEKAAKAEAKAEAQAEKDDKEEAKHKHFIRSIYLDELGVFLVGARATPEIIKAIRKEDVSKYVA